MVQEVVLQVAGPADVAKARRAVTGMVGDGDAELADNVRLTVSELLTNAIVHGRPPVVLVARVDRQTLRIEVGDASPARGSPQQASATASSGRGLAIVDAVAHRWGTESRGEGKATWLEYSLAPAGAWAEAVVQLLNVPVDAYLRGQEHLESTLHEIQVLASAEPAGFAALEAATVVPLRQAMDVFRTSRQQGRAEAQAAASAGRAHSDFAWRLPAGAADAARAWGTAVAELERLAAAGVLLTPPPDAEVSRLRRWLSSEVAGQLAGRPPTPFA